MGTVVEKRVQIDSHRAKQLEKLAGMQGTTESALIEAGLDLLFQEYANLNSGDDALRADWEFLRQWESEFGSLETRAPALKIDPNEIVSIVGTPVNPAKVRRIGDLP